MMDYKEYSKKWTTIMITRDLKIKLDFIKELLKTKNYTETIEFFLKKDSELNNRAEEWLKVYKAYREN